MKGSSDNKVQHLQRISLFTYRNSLMSFGIVTCLCVREGENR